MSETAESPLLPAVSIVVELYPGFTIDQAQRAIQEIGLGLNQMLGIALMSGALTSGNPITHAVLNSAAALEQAHTQIDQMKQQRQAQLGIVQAQPVPVNFRRN